MKKAQTTSCVEALFPEDTPKARVLKFICDASTDALLHANNEVASQWENLLKKDGAFAVQRKSQKSATKEKAKKAKPKKRHVQENAITSELEPSIRSYIGSLKDDHVARVLGLSCHIDQGIHNELLAGDKEKRNDIRFQTFNAKSFDLVFEAKVLRAESELNERYFGDEGLNRFLRSQNPYTVSPLAGLIAYVDNKKRTKWRNLIKNRIKAVTGCREIRLINVGELGLRKEMVTHHSRALASDPFIWMLHFQFGFPYLEVDDVPESVE